jgi:hypothetical protein
MISLVKKKHAKGITNFSKSQIQRALINTVLNLSSDPKEANLLMRNPLFKHILKIGFETLDIGLLKIINNVTYFCPPELTQKMEKTVVVIRGILNTLVYEQQCQNMLAISEILSILSNCCLGEKYDNFLDPPTLKIIQTFQNHQYDHIRL